MLASVVRVPWHTPHGGYDRLLDHLPEVRPSPDPSARSLHGSSDGLTHARPALPAAVLPGRALRHRPAPVDLARGGPRALRGEQYWFSRRRPGPTVVTYHQPPARLKQLLPPGTWRKLAPTAARIIVLAPTSRRSSPA